MKLQLAVIELLNRLNDERIRKRKRYRVKLKISRRSNIEYKLENFHRTLKRIGKIRNIEIHIYPNDHDPPHFHVKCRGQFEVKVSIVDNSILDVKFGTIRRNDKQIILTWAEENNELLWREWKSMRPTVISYSA